MFSLYFLIKILIVFLAFLFINNEYKKVLKDIYKIDSKGFFWNSAQYSYLVISKFEDILNESGIKEKEQLEYLINLMDRNTAELKVPTFIGNGIIAGIILPVWLQFVDLYFKKQISTPQEGLGFLCAVTVVVFIIIGIIHQFKNLLDEELINRKYYEYKRIGNNLRELYLLKLGEKKVKEISPNEAC